MKIAIDGREIGQGKAGKGRYVIELVKALSTIDKENLYIIYVWKIPKFKLNDNYRFVILPEKGIRFIWVASNLIKEKVDVFLSPTGYHPVIFSPVKTILVVHDLAVFLEPKARPAFKTKFIEKTTLPFALKKATHIITVSKNTKKDIIDYFNIKPGKITPIHLAPFPSATRSTPEKILQTKYKLTKRIILFVGTLEPRKNVESLIKAYNMLRPALKKNCTLVLVGNRGWNTGQITKALGDSPKDSNILEIGFLTDEDLSGMYKLATIFVYPSWYEGFGLPPLEAMKHGVPTITSNNSSLPEVVGEGAITIDPGDVKLLTQTIEKLLTSPSIQSNLKKKALMQSGKFNWEKTARETLTVIKEVYNLDNKS